MIELMIVVAIIGILAAVAIPAYSDYIKTAKVTEAKSLFYGFKTKIDEFYAEAGHFPKTQKSLEELGVITTGSYFKAYYSFDDPEMWLTLIVLDRMGGKLEEAGAGAKKITWQYINTKGQWTCKNSENGGKTTIDDKYLPKACK